MSDYQIVASGPRLDPGRELIEVYDAGGKYLGVLSDHWAVDEFTRRHRNRVFYLVCRVRCTNAVGLPYFATERFEILLVVGEKPCYFPVRRVPSRRSRSVDLAGPNPSPIAPTPGDPIDGSPSVKRLRYLAASFFVWSLFAALVGAGWFAGWVSGPPPRPVAAVKRTSANSYRSGPTAEGLVDEASRLGGIWASPADAIERQAD